MSKYIFCFCQKYFAFVRKHFAAVKNILLLSQKYFASKSKIFCFSESFLINFQVPKFQLVTSPVRFKWLVYLVCQDLSSLHWYQECRVLGFQVWGWSDNHSLVQHRGKSFSFLSTVIGLHTRNNGHSLLRLNK